MGGDVIVKSCSFEKVIQMARLDFDGWWWNIAKRSSFFSVATTQNVLENDKFILLYPSLIEIVVLTKIGCLRFNTIWRERCEVGQLLPSPAACGIRGPAENGCLPSIAHNSTAKLRKCTLWKIKPSCYLKFIHHSKTKILQSILMYHALFSILANVLSIASRTTEKYESSKESMF